VVGTVEVADGDVRTQTITLTVVDEGKPWLTFGDIAMGQQGVEYTIPEITVSDDSGEEIVPEVKLYLLDGDEKEVSLYVSKNMLSLEIDDTVLTSKLYVGEFVRKENIYPAEFSTQILLSRKEMIESVERASVVIRGDKNNLILLDVKNGSVVITANSDMGNVAESVSAELEGRELKIAMNGKYLMDALKALEEEKIYISFNSSVSPFVAENEQDKTASYLILPVRTSNTTTNN
jgi:DNA polymerase-3 subunit beta